MLIAMVTGPSSGIGRAVTLELARRGYHVVAAGRSRTRIEPVIREAGQADGSAEFLELDLASFASVRSAVDRFLASRRALDVLVNNAGIGINRRGLTEDGFEVHFGINHLGHHLLTEGLMPAFRPGTRIVALASAVHQRAKGIDFERARRPTRFTGYGEYAVSKLANILFIRELAARHAEWNSYAVHPGLVDTALIPRWVGWFTRSEMLTPEQGADTVVWCATSDEVAGQSGHYYQRRTRTLPSAEAQDDDLARRLWEQSEAWCK